MRQLDPRTFVSAQICPEEVAALPEGIKTIVNNRPDGEEPGQPISAEIEAAAQAARLDYRHIPIAGGFTEADVDRMADALAGEGKVFAFCKSGTRSAFLWALAEARRGADGGELIAKAAAAGYDLSPIRRLIT
jgi:uncharacterized protein (TIGR01244 family)